MLYLDEAIFDRRSVRRFKQTAVEKDKIIKILDAGRRAPSAKNRQPWLFSVLSPVQKEKIAELLEDYAVKNPKRGTEKETARAIRSAPTAIAIFLTGTTISDYISLGACLENMSLKAVDLGLGSLIVCDTQSIDDELTVLFGERRLAVLFIAGYADDDSKRIKKPLAALVDGIDVNNEENGVIDNLPEADISDKPFIFISYSHRDANIVISDVTELKKHGVRLWYDRSIYYGEIWDEKALSIIDKPNCMGVLLYVSDNAVRSESIAKELNHASRRFRDTTKIVSVHIGDKPLSGYSIPPHLLSAFQVIPDEKKYIPRNKALRSFNILPIVAEANRLGVVATSGTYDEFSYELLNDGVCITKYNGCSRDVKIISTVSDKPVVAIGKNAFRGNDIVRNITVPFTVKRIEEGAFFEMKELVKIELPHTMEYIGVAAFRGCEKLPAVKLPDGINILSEALFRDCTALTECDVPTTVVEFGEAVFRNCSNLRRVNMPSVKKMTEGGFYGCETLQDLTINPAICGLEKQSFETCPLINMTAGGFTFVNGKATES